MELLTLYRDVKRIKRLIGLARQNRACGRLKLVKSQARAERNAHLVGRAVSRSSARGSCAIVVEFWPQNFFSLKTSAYQYWPQFFPSKYLPINTPTKLTNFHLQIIGSSSSLLQFFLCFTQLQVHYYSNLLYATQIYVAYDKLETEIGSIK